MGLVTGQPSLGLRRIKCNKTGIRLKHGTAKQKGYLATDVPQNFWQMCNELRDYTAFHIKFPMGEAA